jgi:hypothetical protein
VGTGVVGVDAHHSGAPDPPGHRYGGLHLVNARVALSIRRHTMTDDSEHNRAAGIGDYRAWTQQTPPPWSRVVGDPGRAWSTMPFAVFIGS